jgi:hypothetical protein
MKRVTVNSDIYKEAMASEHIRKQKDFRAYRELDRSPSVYILQHPHCIPSGVLTIQQPGNAGLVQVKNEHAP